MYFRRMRIAKEKSKIQKEMICQEIGKHEGKSKQILMVSNNIYYRGKDKLKYWVKLHVCKEGDIRVSTKCPFIVPERKLQ